MSDNGQQVPLIERLRSVPAAARVLEHTPNPLGYDTASIPVGALCREAAERIAELEGALETAQRERDEIRARSIRRKAELAAERERWEEAEVALAAERGQREASAPEDVARRFHDAYEYFAPQFGCATRPESRKEWDELPQNLRDLMIAVVRNVLIEQPSAPTLQEQAMSGLT